jgi:cell division protein YceG involved in septum cleavage
MKTDKMYFVAKDDGSREHFFSIDNSEHVRFKDIAATNRNKRGQEKPKSKP